MRTQLAVVAALLVVAASAPAVAGSSAGAATAQEQCSFPVTETDATGTEVTVDEEPAEVVVLGSSAAQVMWEVGAEEKVTGMPVGPYTSYLDGYEERTNVREGRDYKKEVIVSLDPDLVIAPNIVTNATVQDLRDAGLTVYRAGFGRSLEDIYAKTELYGRMVGHCEGADEVVAHMKDRVATVREAVEGEDKPRVLYYMAGNFTAGEGTFISALVETAGGDNVAVNAGIEGYKPLNEEIVAERNPQWIVHSGYVSVPDRSPYSGTIAVQQNQTLTVNANYVSQPGPRVVIPLTTMAEAFHPEAFAAANATATPTSTPSSTPTATEASSEPTPSDTTGNGAGFGAAVAVVALAGALLARRQ